MSSPLLHQPVKVQGVRQTLGRGWRLQGGVRRGQQPRLRDTLQPEAGCCSEAQTRSERGVRERGIQTKARSAARDTEEHAHRDHVSVVVDEEEPVRHGRDDQRHLGERGVLAADVLCEEPERKAHQRAGQDWDREHEPGLRRREREVLGDERTHGAVQHPHRETEIEIEKGGEKCGRMPRLHDGSEIGHGARPPILSDLTSRWTFPSQSDGLPSLPHLCTIGADTAPSRSRVPRAGCTPRVDCPEPGLPLSRSTTSIWWAMAYATGDAVRSVSELSTRATHCPYCSLQCAMDVRPANSGGWTVHSRHFPTNPGGLCQKGWTALELLTRQDRLLTP